MSIEVNQLTKRYGDQVAVNGISFQVGRGEIVGFLGPNGAGKSTTMKMLTGFIPPDSGTAFVAGYDVRKFSREGRRKVGYLPESNPLYTHMFVREYLDLIAGLNRLPEKRKRIGELLEATGLLPEANKQIRSLSKGYKQRVGLAQALLSDPEVLILDEPTSGLDPNQLTDIRTLIRETGREKTILLSTHIMQEVARMCDRVLIIDKGEIVADQLVSELSSSAGSECRLEVGFEQPLSEADLEAIPFRLVEKISANRFVFAGPHEAEMSKAINRFAVERDNAVLHLAAQSRDLEEVFRDLTSNKKEE
jgi:ABC-2 type transport system ATP-binding protein